MEIGVARETKGIENLIEVIKSNLSLSYVPTAKIHSCRVPCCRSDATKLFARQPNLNLWQFGVNAEWHWLRPQFCVAILGMQVLKLQGQEIVSPDQRSGLHPLAIPLSRGAPPKHADSDCSITDNDVYTCLLRWPASAATQVNLRYLPRIDRGDPTLPSLRSGYKALQIFLDQGTTCLQQSKDALLSLWPR